MAAVLQPQFIMGCLVRLQTKHPHIWSQAVVQKVASTSPSTGIHDNIRGLWSGKSAPLRPWFCLAKVLDDFFRWRGILWLDRISECYKWSSFLTLYLPIATGYGIAQNNKVTSPCSGNKVPSRGCWVYTPRWVGMLDNLGDSWSTTTASMNREDPFEVVQAPYKDTFWSAATRDLSDTSYLLETTVQTQDTLESGLMNTDIWADLLSLLSLWLPPGYSRYMTVFDMWYFVGTGKRWVSFGWSLTFKVSVIAVNTAISFSPLITKRLWV